MAGGPAEIFEIPYQRLFPWLRLFRAFGLASSTKKLLLAALGLILMQVGWNGIDRLFAQTGPERAASAHWSFFQPLGPMFSGSPGGYLYSVALRVTEPVRYLAGPFVNIFQAGANRAAFLHAVLTAAWGAIVWGLLGGALARMTLAQFGRSETLGTRAALRFGFGKWLTLIGSPLCPLIGVGMVAVLCLPIGLLYRIPSVGPAAAGVLAFLPLLAGLMMAILLLGLLFGWPLMPSAVAAEEGDGFDALSRSYSYVNQRRSYYLFMILLAWLLGIAGLIFVDVIARLVIELALWALGFTAPAGVLRTVFATGGTDASMFAVSAHAFWFAFIGLLAHAWIYSYFWSSASIIYLLLRHDVDGTPLHDLPWLPPAAEGAPVLEPAPVPGPAETPAATEAGAAAESAENG